MWRKLDLLSESGNIRYDFLKIWKIKIRWIVVKINGIMWREEFSGIGRRKIGIEYRKKVGLIIIDRFKRLKSRKLVKI